MSVSDEEPYSTIFASLKHPIRRRILRMLAEKHMSFSEMLEALGVSNSFLTYHLDNLGELLGKSDDGRYKLSSFGEAAMSTMTKVEDIPTTARQQLPKTKPNRVVRRSVAIALGVICILLISSLGGALAYYTMVMHNKESELDSANRTISRLNANVTNLRNQYDQLQTWLNGNETLLNQTQVWLSGNATAYNQLQDEASSIYIAGTTNSTVLVNNETVYEYSSYDAYTAGYVFIIRSLLLGSFPSAGYVVVLFSSNSTSASIEISYPVSSSVGLSNVGSFDFDVGSNGTIVFPVLPSTNYSMTIFMSTSSGQTSVCTVTIIYYS